MEKLPQSYLDEAKELFKDDYEDYLDSLSSIHLNGLRINTNKISVEDFLRIAPFELKPIPWTQDGFYFKEEERPSKHPYYYAGLYYIQEPSAMLPAEVLPIEENDIVLDACAAPGGKSLKLADKLKKSGILVSNDISVSRAQILLSNLERHGVTNSFVMAEDLVGIDRFDNRFDKILLDAPCSGQGMFRKEKELIKSYIERDSAYYAPIQKQLICKAAEMLKDGGMMVYSTCTFSKKENEEVIEYALERYPDLKVLPISKCDGFVSGLTEKTRNCVRLYPHKIEGEGHFVALLQKGNSRQNTVKENTVTVKPEIPFFKDVDYSFNNGTFIKRENRLYFEPSHDLDLKGLRVLRSGLYLGEFKHDKFEPSFALAMALDRQSFRNTIDLKADDERVIKYLKCETINVSDFDKEGYVLMMVNQQPLGFGISHKGILKNNYPAGYRYK
ncbi:MAG: RsmB/NOP family class I SAM-dependent RNA methyltransferase [Erysipelotrichaceae bacterium]|nr:RsmB/NOP family class I SAM-dependent RNA methyltransferase [Erysipelotrichaceae bacterium]